MGACPRA
jgi:hypothetical protein